MEIEKIGFVFRAGDVESCLNVISKLPNPKSENYRFLRKNLKKLYKKDIKYRSWKRVTKIRLKKLGKMFQ